MSSHAFDVISKSRTQIELAHHEEGHRYTYSVTRNGASSKDAMNSSTSFPLNRKRSAIETAFSNRERVG